MRSRGSIFILAALCAASVACSRTDSAAVPVAAAATGGGSSYEVVTVERPESVGDYHKLYKAGYDMCATTRELKKMPPPPPMLQPPADFISERKTYISDGKAYLVKQEYFVYKMKMEEPSFTCETYLEKTSNTQLVRDGKVYNAAVDETGKRSSEPAEEWILPRESRKERIYTEPKTVKGQAVKCMPMLPNTDELLTELCIADLKPGTLTDVVGEPIVLSSRVTSAQKVLGAVLTEPVSVKVGGKIDKAVFDAAAAP
jgi:hypothetical protein